MRGCVGAEVVADDKRIDAIEAEVEKLVVEVIALRAPMANDLRDVIAALKIVSVVERIGDYSKNLSELPDMGQAPFPDDELTHELLEIRQGIEGSFEAALEVFESSDQEKAIALIRQGRDVAHRCDSLIGRIAKSTYDASTTTVLVLAARYYKRIGGHVLNVLSSVIMPLHKVDYYDEDEIPSSVKAD